MSAIVKRRRGPAWLHPGWSWTVRQAWVITALSASITLSLGAVLGALPALLAGSWHDAQTRDQTWVLIVFVAVSLGAAGTAVLLIRKRRRVLRQNGTAYVVQEFAADWARQDERVFLDSAGRHFARVIEVPGPGQLGPSWDWPLDDRARMWDAKVTELVRSFQALHSDDDPHTPNGVLMWARWAVAAAFGMRVTAADRDLVLDVWQRPSHARSGDVEATIRAQRPHRFGSSSAIPLGQALPESMPHEFTWLAKLTSTSLASALSEAANPVGVLLLRLGQQSWGPLRDLSAQPKRSRQVELEIVDATGLVPSGSSEVSIHEFRYMPPAGGRFPWSVFPSLVSACTDWIERKAADLEGHTLLLAGIMPQETALGLGIAAGQPRRTGWPTNIWPIVYAGSGDNLVIPRLNLGTAALRNRPADGDLNGAHATDPTSHRQP
jgi:hypothetical protein